MARVYKVKSKVVPYPGMAAWYFAYVDKALSQKIRDEHARKKAGFGSIRVVVALGKSKWKTSIFPDAHSGCYLLPLKKEVRRAEDVDAGDTITFMLSI